jgi:hypothetical protein
MDEFTKIAREIKFGSTSIRKNVTSILVGYAVCLQFAIMCFNLPHQQLETAYLVLIFDALGEDDAETIFRAISLTPLCKGTMSVSN